MAKLDGFLNQLASRGGTALYLSPGAPATVELPGGHRAMLGTQDLLSPIIDGLVKEVLPDEQKTAYLRGDMVAFQRQQGDSWFEIRATRSSGTTSLLAHRLVRAAKPAAAAVAADAELAIKAMLSPGTAPAQAQGKRQTTQAAPPVPPPVLVPPPVVAPPPVIETASPSEATRPGLFPWEDLIAKLLEMGGSDLYLSPNEPPLVRHNGAVEPIPGCPPAPVDALTKWLETLATPRHWKAFQEHGQADFSHSDAQRDCRLRVNLSRDLDGPSAAIRVVPDQIPEDEVLALPDAVLELADIPKGLVLIAGTPGSGRTTTLAALLRRAAQKRGGFLISVGDSMEFLIPPAGSVVRQRETGGDYGDQRRAIRAALKQAPDVLAVDAVRDGATALQVLEAGMSGRLVFALVEAPSALSALERLVDRQPPDSQHLVRALLVTGLKAVTHQVLLRRPNGGRVAAFETIFNSPDIQAVLRKWDLSRVPSAMKSGRAYGQVTQAEALLELVQAEAVEAMEAYTHCHDRQSFVAACKAAKLDFDPRRSGQVA
ncbi:MAG TPA: ATPase, T2SS/T4P/T4SS family [Holophagaceae bacterium]|jgi:twitching motility protein PilT|nr:ATPase, T2SS/T4P/T4SS family [Holophagaceae bacterium]